ncbi:hypothetical protein SO802_025148 [Lithocarpus litseifolius]|uniref:Uncharacterized protein n=1 Tax=Lithocarpus litseifolius TaxID=425828 RepID=A0AAW2BXI0_9ROSI
MEYNPLYDANKGFNVMPSSFHDISDVEFQDNWGRFWVDLETSNYFAIDVLLNCLIVLSSNYLGIQQILLLRSGYEQFTFFIIKQVELWYNSLNAIY